MPPLIETLCPLFKMFHYATDFANFEKADAHNFVELVKTQNWKYNERGKQIVTKF